jgi:hypothetical protein
MVSYLSFVTLALAGTVAASVISTVENTVNSRKLGMESNLEKRTGVDCSDTTQASFISAS